MQYNKKYNAPHWRSLHKAATLQLDAKLRLCASIIGDKRLIAKLSSSDLIALNAVYHLPCLTELYRKAGLNKDNKSEDMASTAHALAFSELVDYLENQCHTGQVFKMATLSHMYEERLITLGIKDPYVHTTRLREDLLVSLPDLYSVKSQGKSSC